MAIVVPAGFTVAPSSATEPPLNSELGRLMLSSENERFVWSDDVNFTFYVHRRFFSYKSNAQFEHSTKKNEAKCNCEKFLFQIMIASIFDWSFY